MINFDAIQGDGSENSWSDNRMIEGFAPSLRVNW